MIQIVHETVRDALSGNKMSRAGASVAPSVGKTYDITAVENYSSQSTSLVDIQTCWYEQFDAPWFKVNML